VIIDPQAVLVSIAYQLLIGLPVIRTSVDHGTAFDIAGTGNAGERSSTFDTGAHDEDACII
jgi:4-hydroxy-L-threonine phosphate dehydrogenase PdxA